MRDNTVPRVAKWVVLSDTLHSRLLSRSQWRRFIASRYSLRRGNVTAPCNLSAVKMRRREKRTEAKEEKEKKYESRGSIVNLTHFSERRRIKLPFVCLLFSHDSHLYSRSRGIRIFLQPLKVRGGRIGNRDRSREKTRYERRYLILCSSTAKGIPLIKLIKLLASMLCVISHEERINSSFEHPITITLNLINKLLISHEFK